MPDAVARLREIGVEPRGLPFRGIRYFDGGLVGRGALPAVRRPGGAADRAARGAGPPGGGGGRRVLRWGSRRMGFTDGGVRPNRGRSPPAGSWAPTGCARRSALGGLDGGEAPAAAFGVRRHYAMEPWTIWSRSTGGPARGLRDPGGRRTRWASRSSGASRKAGFDDLLASFPRARPACRGADRLARPRSRPASPARPGVTEATWPWSAMPPATSTPSPARGWRWRSTSRRRWSKRSNGGSPSLRGEHRRIDRLPNLMTALVLALERRPVGRRRSRPWLPSRPCSCGSWGFTRELPPRQLGLGALRLAWRLVVV